MVAVPVLFEYLIRYFYCFPEHIPYDNGNNSVTTICATHNLWTVNLQRHDKAQVTWDITRFPHTHLWNINGYSFLQFFHCVLNISCAPSFPHFWKIVCGNQDENVKKLTRYFEKCCVFNSHSRCSTDNVTQYARWKGLSPMKIFLK